MIGRDNISKGIEGRLFRLALGGLLTALFIVKAVDCLGERRRESAPAAQEISVSYQNSSSRLTARIVH